MRHEIYTEVLNVRGIGTDKALEIERVLTARGWPMEINGCTCYGTSEPVPTKVEHRGSCPLFRGIERSTL